MRIVQQGDRVQVHYVKRSPDGRTVSSREPLQLTVGINHARLPGLGVALVGLTEGQVATLTVPPERAILWLTANPARSLGLSARIGSLEPGKMADVVVWNGTPFSVYAFADLVYIDGALRYDRAHPEVAPRSDFLIGQPAAPEVTP